MTLETQRKLELALRAIIDSESKATNWAKGYAHYAMGLVLSYDPLTSNHTLHTQLLYVLNNITHWREPDSKLHRAAIKMAIAETGVFNS